jgi:surfeit locus 1 family protein
VRSRGLWWFVLAAVVAAAVFVRLGFWQLSRLHERRARNALVLSRLDSAQVDFWSLPRDTALARYRRVTITGTPDYAHELLWAARINNGSPGVNFLTPVLVPGHDTAVLVDRGWVYSPDGATVDEAQWRESDTTFVGYAQALPSLPGTAYSTRPNTLARLGYAAAAKALPYPVSPTYIVMLGDSAVGPNRIVRLGVPPLDEGPHFSYAVQWFGFAVVALAGVVFVILQDRERRAGRGASTVPR